MPDEAPRRSSLELAEGLHLAHAAAALHRLGLFEAMAEPVPAEALAAAFRLDPEMLQGTLDYLAARTDLVLRAPAGYRAGAAFDREARFLLSLYAGAFAPAAAGLAESLRRPRSAPGKVDRAAQARAFDDGEAAPAGALPGILRQLGLTFMLDLGCGPAAILCRMASADPGFFGWGLDANPAMCRIARREAREAGVSRRVRIIEGDGRFPERALPASLRSKVKTLLAGDFVNEMCRGRGKAAVAWLRRMRRLFPGRVLVVSDYYGRLGSREREAAPETLLHDFVQVISGQGIPPADAAAWQQLYEQAGCRLAHVLEDPATTRFVHLVVL